MKNMIKFNRFKDGKRHCLTFSYDDCQIYDERLVEIFERYGMKGTFHLNSGNLDKENYIRADRINNLYKNHEVACHMVSHPFPRNLPDEQLLCEVLEDRRNLEKLIGYPVRGLSYPFGQYDNQVIKAARCCGIVYSRTVENTGKFDIPKDFMTWQPTCHHNACLESADRFFGGYGYNNGSQLFYVWGHSFEFARANNWNLMEEFCKRMSADENIWYATNIEIYDYIQGIKRLQITLDNKTVYNPSAMDLWFTSDNKTVKISGGEMLRL